MPRLGNILSDRDEIAISTSDGDIHIEYYPSRVTQKMLNQFQSLGRMASSNSASEEELKKASTKAYGMLLHLIKSWDLDDEIPCDICDICKANEGKDEYEQEECQSKKVVPFPLVPERMDDLPVWLFGSIAEALVSGPNQKAPQKKRN
jgi:hypothetical protein